MECCALQSANEELALEKQIEAAKKQLRFMKNQNRNLAETMADLEFSLEELEYEQEVTEDTYIEENDPDTYFEYLGMVEECEEALKNLIKENQTKCKSATSYQHRLLLQNKALEEKLQTRGTRLSNLVTENRAIEDELREMELNLETKKTDETHILSSIESMSQELLQQTSGQNEGLLRELRETNLHLKKELEMRKRELNEANTAIKRCESEAQKRKDTLQREVQSCQSVKSWEGERKALNSKLKEARKKLISTNNMLDAATNKDLKTRDEILAITGPSDPGDATGQRAKQLLQCEIEAFASTEITSHVTLEEEYESELATRLCMVTKAQTDFEHYRQEVISSLHAELEISEQRGYLDLLKSEVNAAKHSVYVRC